MNTLVKSFKLSGTAILVGTLLVAAGCASPNRGLSESTSFSMYGSQENPGVVTPAIGFGTIEVWPDRTIAVGVSTFEMTGTAAHIHEGAMGVNGPVVIPLIRVDNRWAVPAGTKLTDAQYTSYKAGNLYVNVHSAAYPNGQMRAQLMPK